MQEVIFNGTAGKIEGKFHASKDIYAPVALVLHPHPAYGGTMNNKVVYKIFHTFVANNFSVLRFNFRGVGRSQGVFDNGVGELLDAASALDWLQAHATGASCWVAGFSFGAWIGMQLLMRRPELHYFISVSPPAHSQDFSFLSPCPTPGIIVQGTKDEVVSEKSVFSLYEKIDKQKNSDVEYAAITDADHFFTNHMNELEKELDDYIKEKANIPIEVLNLKKTRKNHTGVPN
ncbi:MAG: alpha/beta hydrolase [Proteobacteria bacterium]|nr:alpha/beta hydrolase [Pseudomonadota bacterium]